jgi:hypothetical protein
VATQRWCVRHGLNAGEVRGKARHDGAWGLAVECDEVSDELFERWAQAAEACGCAAPRATLMAGDTTWPRARKGRPFK